MSYDEQPDGDIHGECALEIKTLGERITTLERENAEARDEITRLNFVAEGQALLIAELEQQLEAARKDAERLAFAMSETDGFILIEKDKYDFAIECATESGRDVPIAEDELNGIRRLIDAAIEATQQPKEPT